MKLSIIYFSPTRTTLKVLNSIAEGLNPSEVERIDLTRPENRKKEFSINSDFCIIGCPDYEARVPPIIRHALTFLNGNNTPTAALITYGNRTIGIALKQLVGILNSQNFKIIATGTFVAEHSYANEDLPIALGRPNQKDLDIAKKMGEELLEKRNLWEKAQGINEKNIGGKIKALFKLLPEGFLGSFGKPGKFIQEKCTKCLICVKLCPTAAIDPQSFSINKKKCIRCMACVKFCPEKARPIKYKSLSLVRQFMRPAIKIKRDPRYKISID